MDRTLWRSHLPNKNKNSHKEARKAQESVNNNDSALLLVVSVPFCGPGFFRWGKLGRLWGKLAAPDRQSWRRLIGKAGGA
jgi:hypothetical protein